MGILGESLTIVKIIGIVWLGAALLWSVKGIVFWLSHLLVRLARPLEFRLLQWLQDRAYARTLGVDIDVIRVRRKVEYPPH